MKPKSVSIHLHDVDVAYEERVVVSNVNLDVAPGEFFTFLGPSGSGKSTLLRAIAGFGPMPSGQIRIGPQDVTRLPPWKRDVGMVFQNYALWPHMTVRKNVAFGLEERRLRASEIRERVDAALDLVGLRGFADRRPGQLSGGQQQRVALARTVVVEPRVLLLDEPLSNLDANLRVRMRREIRELQQRLNITTVYVTHDQDEANTVSDRIAVLNEGRLQQVGAPMALYDHPANRFVARFLGAANLLDGEIIKDGNIRVFHADNGLRIPLSAETDLSGRGTALFRPHNLRLIEKDAGRRDRQLQLTGAIVHREFLGNLIRYRVAVDGQELLIDEEHLVDRCLYDLGNAVELVLDTTQVQGLTS